MKLKRSEIPDWQKKLDFLSRSQLRRWKNGSERPLQNLNCFVSFADNSEFHKKMKSLGVVLTSVGGGINTASIPWHNLQQVCECPFVKSVTFAKPLKIVYKPLPNPDMGLPDDLEILRDYPKTEIYNE